MKTKEIKKELKKMVDNLFNDEMADKMEKFEQALNEPAKIYYERNQNGKTEVEIEGNGWALMAGLIAMKKHVMKTVGCGSEEIEALENILGCSAFDNE